MKKCLIVSIIVSISFCSNDTFSQKIKIQNNSFKYEMLPQRPVPINYKTYKIEVTSGGTDGIPLDSKLIRIDDKYIKGFQNATFSVVQDNMDLGAFKIESNNSKEKSKSSPTDLEITVAFNNIELIDKKDESKKIMDPSTHIETNYFNYNLSFKFSYVVKVKDVKKNQFLLDTLIDIQKNTLFPTDYRYDNFGNKIICYGDHNKPELDIDYNKNSQNLYLNSKTILAPKCMNDVKNMLTAFYGYDVQSKYFTISRIKSKNPLFDNCDTAMNAFNNVLDSISFNAQNEKHLNWHTSSIRNQIKKSIAIWEDMIINEKYLNEFKDQQDKDDFINKTKRNLMVGYLLEDDFKKALALYNEIELGTRSKIMGQTFQDDNLKIVFSLIKNEGANYNTHKAIFNFD